MKNIFISLFCFALFGASGLNAQVGQIIWQENFNSLDSGIWNAVTGNGCEQASGCGWGNQELEYYQSENLTIEQIPGETGNNALVIQAKKETVGTNQFTSGKISSQNKLAIKYGFIEVRMKAPDVEKGLWPAVWLLGTNLPAVGWPRCGEIDMMEMGQSLSERTKQGYGNISANNYVGANLLWYTPAACSGSNPTCAASIANDTYYDQPYVATTALSNRFLIYRLYWDDKSIRFTSEDNGVENDLYTGPFPIGANESAFTKPFYFLLNLAVGGTFTDASVPSQVTASLPAKMYIDYIRVRKWNGKGEIIMPQQLIANAGVNQTLSDGKAVKLDASGSYGNIQTYSWSENGVTIATGKTDTITLSSGSHEITLTVTDDKGNIASDNITLQIGSSQIGEIIWQDDFNTLDTALWNAENSNGCEGSSGCGFGNHELEYYSPNNLTIEPISGEAGNNALVIQAKKETVGSNQFTSGKLSTLNKLAIKYGLIEVRMKAPAVETGLWPAVWLLGANMKAVGWPRCGEIDMMEMGHKAAERTRQGFSGVSANNYVGANLLWYNSAACAADNATCAASIAYDVNYNNPYAAASPLNNRFVTYRLYWDEQNIRFTITDNGNETDLYTNPFPIGANESAFQQPFYLLMNLAVGGDFTDAAQPGQVTATLPAKMYIDYVKVSKWKGKGEVSYNGGKLLANAGADQVKTDLDKNGNETITLDATGSYGKIASYIWSESGVQLATGAKATINLSTGDHYITLTATDSTGKTSTDEVRIEIREILWEDNFNTLDSSLWNAVTGDGCSSPSGCGWGNQELEYYSPNNLSIEPVSGEDGNNALVLEAKKEIQANSQFTSGKITSQDKVAIKYGLIEVRMKSPAVETGLWPAAWLLGANLPTVGWPKCGEIDMMEMGQSLTERTKQGYPNVSTNNYVGANLIWYSPDACNGSNPTCAASIANDAYYDQPYIATSPLNNRFVIYRLYWQSSSIRFTVEDNGSERDLYTGPFPISSGSAAFQKPFYFLLNLAVGGTFTDAKTNSQVTAPMPAKMFVDYVRVLKWKGQGEVTFKDGLTANAGPDAIVLDKDKNGTEKVYLDGSASNDMNGSIASYSWTENNKEISTDVMPVIDLPRGIHNIILTVTDNDGNKASDKVIVTVTSGGSTPIAVAGNDTTLYDDNGDDIVSFTLNGSESSDPNDSPLTYSWSENGKELATDVLPTLDLKTGKHKITLTVTNEDSLSSTDEILINVIDPDNNPPAAYAGDDLTVYDNDGNDTATIALDATGSTDLDGTIESYTWKENGKEIVSGSTPSFDLSTGKHLLTLEVTDNDGITASDEILITVIDPDNQAPVAIAGNDTIITDNDRNGSQSFSLNGSNSYDSDGFIASYLWKENDSEIAKGKTATANLSVGLHTLVLETTDNDGTANTDTVKIKVAQKPIASAGKDTLVKDLDGNGSELINMDGTASTAPFGSIVSYSWKEKGIEIATGQTTSYNFAKGTHVVTLVVTNDDGFTASDEVVLIVANPANASPIADAGNDITEIDLDNSGSQTLTLDGSGSYDTDGEIYSYQWFEEDKVIALGVSPLVDFTIGIHEVVLVVTDNEGTISKDTAYITIKHGKCIYEVCTKDYTVSIISDNTGNTSIKFIPAKIGNGDKTCLLYYGTDLNGSFPGNNVTPYQYFKIPNASPGQKIYFYYTYSLATGGEQNTNSCKQSFTVGDCFAEPNKLPIANAGADFSAKIPLGESSVNVILDGSGSNDSDGNITSYIWTEGSTQIATGVKPSVNLKAGTHSIYLIVTDNSGESVRDVVKVSVTNATEINNLSTTEEINLYPVPVKDWLNISSKSGVEKIQVYNIFGSKVAEALGNRQINMAKLNKGLYFISIKINEKTIIKKVVKE